MGGRGGGEVNIHVDTPKVSVQHRMFKIDVTMTTLVLECICSTKLPCINPI